MKHLVLSKKGKKTNAEVGEDDVNQRIDEQMATRNLGGFNKAHREGGTGKETPLFPAVAWHKKKSFR